MRIASIGKLWPCRGGMGHCHQRYTEMGVGVHRQPQTEGMAQLAKMLNLADASPVMWIAQHNLHRVGSDAFRQIGKGSYRHVAGQGSMDSSRNQLLPYIRHSRDVCSWIFKISAVAEFLTQQSPDLDRSRHRPRAIGIKANWNTRSELRAKLAHGFDFHCRIQ